MNTRQIICLGVALIGVLCLALALTHDLVRGAVIHYGWCDVTAIVLGAIGTIVGLTLFSIERSKVRAPKPTPWYARMNIPAVLLLCVLILSVTYTGVLYGQLQTLERVVEETYAIDIPKLGVFHNLGIAIKSISTYAGVFTTNTKGEKVYYGLTRSGAYCRLFRFNVTTEEIDMVLPIEDVQGLGG